MGSLKSICSSLIAFVFVVRSDRAFPAPELIPPEPFPVSMCNRTVLGKAEIVLWRTDPETFRIKAWRSFAAYIWRFLDDARGEFR